MCRALGACLIQKWSAACQRDEDLRSMYEYQVAAACIDCRSQEHHCNMCTWVLAKCHLR